MLADYPGVVRDGHTWVAEHAGQLVGFVVLEPAEDHLLVENVAVDPASQGLGIGGRLLAVAEDEARTLGLPELRLYTNEMMSENLGYYPRRGYRETHRAEQDGYRRVFFTKLLGESAAGAEPAEAEPEAAGAEPAGRVVPGTNHP
jgi:GNAT superfamily N-acetyltransferase